MANFSPVAFGIAGLGGYAGAIRRELIAAQQRPNPPVKLAAVCDPDLVTNKPFADMAREAGAQVFNSLEEMLIAPIEAVWLPVPIPLHRPMTEKAFDAGKAVVCEKPAAGTVDDLDAMIAARDKARLPGAIGFQTIYDPTIVEIKRRMLDGEIGRVQRITVLACWPRSDKYYSRNNWAGAVKRNGAWVLDSPANNALAHYINFPLFMAGATLYETAVPQSIEAELYRARPIENYDTAAMRLMLPGGVPMMVYFTHACAQLVGPVIEITGERGRLFWPDMDHVEFHSPKGKLTRPIPNQRPDMIERLANLIRSVPDERAVATFEVARAQLVTVNGASQATPVYDVPPDYITPATGKDDSPVNAIKGIEDLWQTCVQELKLPHETGRAAWTRPAGKLDLRGYNHFAGLAEK